jgi:hypothetical protein
LSAYTLTVVAQQVVPILTLGWSWMAPHEEGEDEEEEEKEKEDEEELSVI